MAITDQLGNSRQVLMRVKRELARVVSSPILVLCVVVVCTARVRADGLIYRLPADGEWVSYEMSEEGEFAFAEPGNDKRVDAPKGMRLPIKSKGSLRLSSVGRLMYEGDPCRWIELKMEVEITGKLPGSETERKEERRIILKMLIPEKALASGEDPLSHVRRLHYKDGSKPVELVEDEKAKQYEIDRFRPVFPKPAPKTATTDARADEVLDTRLGKLNCKRLTFSSDYDGPLTRGRRGWWSWQGKHDLWLNDDVPFGVAGLKLTLKSSEWSGEKGRSPEATVDSTKSLVLSATGKGAKSELPDSN